MAVIKQTLTASAPGRAGLIGNPTDMYGGSVISCALPLRAWAEFQPANGHGCGNRGLRLACGEEFWQVDTTADLALDGDDADLVRAVLKRFGCQPCEWEGTLSWGSDIPRQAGLAGSTALLAALLALISRLTGHLLDPYALAETVRSIERYDLNIVCGYQDAYMVCFGGLNYMDFRGKAYEDHNNPLATVERLSPWIRHLPAILAHTGVRHHSGNVHKPLRQRWEEGEPQAVNGFRQIARLAGQGKRCLLTQDWQGLGMLMNANHAMVRDLGGSGVENERLIQAALDAGAWGAKLAGAGDGGTIIALHPHPQVLDQALRQAGASAVFSLDIDARGVSYAG